MVPEMPLPPPFPLPPTVTAHPLAAHRCTNAQGRRRARRCKADEEGSWDRLDQISSGPHCIVWGRPWRLKIGEPVNRPRRDTVRERERLISQSDSFFSHVRRQLRRPGDASSVESQALWVAHTPWWSYELFHGKFHGWRRDPARPHDGALFGWLKKEEKKKKEKRGLFRVPQPSSLMKKWNPWDCHRKFILGQQRCCLFGHGRSAVKIRWIVGLTRDRISTFEA